MSSEAPQSWSRRTLIAVAAAVPVAGLAACRGGEPGATPTPTSGPTSGPTGGATGETSGAPSTPTTTTSPSGTAESPSAPASSSTPPKSATPCADLLTEAQRIGQLLMVGVNSSGATAGQLSILAETHAGSVIMMGNTGIGAAGVRAVTDTMREGATQGKDVGLLVATDQEGGLVQRLTGAGLDTIPSARTQATWSDPELRSRAERWGRQLKEAGVDSGLAPVADVVPPEIGKANKPIAANNRGYGSDPQVVAAKVTAVVTGLRAGGLATGLKHFPGLGRVIGNTDFATKVTDDTTTAADPLLAPFVAGMKAHTDMVMISTAIYTKIDARRPAAFSSTVITQVLRGTYGWDGVVISDDLGVAKQVSYLSPGERAVAFLRAGGDLVINVDPATCVAMAKGIAAEAKQDPEFAEELKVKAQRVLRMKHQHGLASCA